MIVADDRTKKNIEIVLPHLDNLSLENVIIILSPIAVKKDGTELLLDVFPLWLEYYRHKNLLNHPIKIVVIGAESEYENLPYYIIAWEEENIWHRFEKIVKLDTIDYTDIPGDCSGKQAVSIFFQGHGEGNIRGVMSNITHYVNNGILHLQESNDPEETKENFFDPARLEMEKFKKRLRKYEPMFHYLPWQKEISIINQMVKDVEQFLENPLQFPGSREELQRLVISSFKGISNLMKIHGISETQNRRG
jgi:hypothetical protein